MTTRLDRLFVLLDSGSTAVTRKAAATQLGEVQRLHPHELNNLLSKVRTFLHSSNWDTRVAAGQAVEAIVSNVAPFYPPGIKEEEGKQSLNAAASSKGDAGFCQISFHSFDIDAVINKGKDLLASEGTEFEQKPAQTSDGSEGVQDRKDKVLQQRKLLNSRLGLSDALDLGVNSEDLVSNDDLLTSIESSNVTSSSKRSAVSTVIVSKKAKKETAAETSSRKSEASSFDEVVDLSNIADWPLEWFADELMNDLFNPSWEVRHGAATGLREVIKLQGKCAGRKVFLPSHLMDSANQSWLEDLSLRLICVLALDKFGDFVSDQVVAPVRESVAQALGSAFNFMTEENIEKSMEILVKLLKRPEWEARHGGLLGLKYLLAVRLDLMRKLLPKIFDSIFDRLKDASDDVSAVAAAALVPVKDGLVDCLPQAIDRTLHFLWDSLLEIDDLTSSTSSILMLLASLLSSKSSKQSTEQLSSLNNLLPRLYPFLGHALSFVRKSVLEAMLTLSTMSSDITSWMTEEILKNTLALLFQRSLVEPSQEVISLIHQTWKCVVTRSNPSILFRSTCSLISGWICLSMHPAKLPIDISSCPGWITVKHHKHEESYDYGHENQLFLGGSESISDGTAARELAVLSARMWTTKLVGLLCARVTSSPADDSSPSPAEYLSNTLLFHLNSKSSIQRTCAALILIEWAGNLSNSGTIASTSNGTSGGSRPSRPEECLVRCVKCLEEIPYYDEIASQFAKLQQEVKELVSMMGINKLFLKSDSLKNLNVWTFDQINQLVTTEYSTVINEAREVKLKAKVRQTLDDKCRQLGKSLTDSEKFHNSLIISTSAVLSCAVVSWRYFPEKLNPLIRPLMDAIKKEEREEIQDLAGKHLSILLSFCPAPAPKVIKNLVTFACCDTSKTPSLSLDVDNGMKNREQKIITLINMQKASEKTTLRRTTSLISRQKSLEPSLDRQDSQTVNDTTEQEVQKELQITTRGASLTLAEIVKYFGSDIPTKLPHLWSYFTTISKVANEKLETPEDTNSIIQALQVVEITAKFLHPSLKNEVKQLLPSLVKLVRSTHPEVRHMASRVFGVLSTIMTREVMLIVVDELLAYQLSPEEVERLGFVEAISCIVESLGLSIVPYIVLLIVPMMSRMSDQNEHVRLLATHCFAQLIQLMPLDSGHEGQNLQSQSLVDGEGLDDEVLQRRKMEERKFLEQLLDPSKLQPFKLSIPVKAELRSYQQQGLNWLAFLNRYKLHGILCDEMGLGKTLMSICILASDPYERKLAGHKVPPSLVICPPTLTGHWVFEVEKFVEKKFLNPIHYTGSPGERNLVKEKIKKEVATTKQSKMLVVASYDIVRNDIDFFSSITWNYCILDEGHVIKNGKTKLSKAVKSLLSTHRLILTGTPIQNNVLELWSLFDFLMPGFLGTERQFMVRYSKPIIASRDAKSSSKEQEAGVLAMEALHRQVLPFVLRRMKEDVLKDLPPKIMQDYYCELSPLQARLYEDFARSHVRKSLEKEVSEVEGVTNTDGGDEKKKSLATAHIFQALQYLRKVCNHPKLVLLPSHPEYQAITTELRTQNTSLSDMNNSAKLVALRQLLLDCGIGCSDSSNLSNSSNIGTESVVSQHRALIFCQLKSMLDIVENDLLKSNMPSVTYLRLDGSIPPGSRHSVVHRFNNDPSIDVLLLTTQVGGLGLNLTGADTVIFVEHDWNPMKDLQAMDRAHRIGQKKVVNVYRLITTGTLEEKIMSLQKFKLTIANTVITQDNSNLQTMGTDQLLDLFSLDSSKIREGQQDKKHDNSDAALQGIGGKGVKSIIENLPDLWNHEAYESEYDLNNFLESLKR